MGLRHRTPRVLLALGFVLFLLPACGGGSAPAIGASAPSKATVIIPKADRFEPFLLELAAGGTVTFKNEDTDGHTVVAMPTDPTDFKFLVLPGHEVSYTFNQSGVYGYYCDAHSDYDRVTGLIKAKKGADAYPISMYGIILVIDSALPVTAGNGKVVVPNADRFQSLAIVVRKGTRVTWSNLDTVAHSVGAVPNASAQFQLLVKAGDRSGYTFSQSGIYPYFCSLHASWNADLKRVEARAGATEYPAAMEGVVFVLP